MQSKIKLSSGLTASYWVFRNLFFEKHVSYWTFTLCLVIMQSFIRNKKTWKLGSKMPYLVIFREKFEDTILIIDTSNIKFFNL